MAQQKILLESGVNELEIIEFYLGKQSFGVNIAKVREFLKFDPNQVNRVPEKHPAVLGTLLNRGIYIPLIDLNLYYKNSEEHLTQIVLVCELNGVIYSFIVDGVNRILRLSWKQIHPVPPELSNYANTVNGVVSVENRNILMLDLETIVETINPTRRGEKKEKKVEEAATTAQPLPQVSLEENKIENVSSIEESSLFEPAESKSDRGDIKLLIAEDSLAQRMVIEEALIDADYTNIVLCKDGQEAYDWLKKTKHEAEEQGANLLEKLDLIISDIEMPAMDGLTLCKKIKTELNLQEIPVCIFSSLITNEMAEKCKQVGATSWLTKSNLAGLIEKIEELTA